MQLLNNNMSLAWEEALEERKSGRKEWRTLVFVGGRRYGEGSGALPTHMMVELYGLMLLTLLTPRSLRSS